MTRGLTKNGRDFSGRAWLARLVALVFVVQSLGLFLAPASARMGAAMADAEMAEISATAPADCPHHRSRGNGHDHGSSDSCPMCQGLGCALAGAPLPDLVFRANQRLIVLLPLPARHVPPRAPPLQTPPARGPPVLV